MTPGYPYSYPRDPDSNHHDLDSNHRDLDSNHRDLDSNHRDLDSNPRDLDSNHRDLDSNHRDLDSNHRDLDSNQSHDLCTMDVLVPTGSTIYASKDQLDFSSHTGSNVQSELPSNTVLGVCDDSLQLAVPQSVISSTNCDIFHQRAEFTEDFQIRYYGMWGDKARGVLVQITGEYMHSNNNMKKNIHMTNYFLYIFDN